MSAAAKIVEKFGGPAILARLIGKGQSTVAYWQKVGTIPAKWQPILIDLAQRNAIGLTALDFIPVPMEDLKPAERAPNGIPTATHWGETLIGEVQIPSYVLDNGMRVFSLKGVVVGLIGTEGGQLGEYLKV
ncbi:MAG: carph-isopro domain-containing protein, partial [Hyphomicrobiaceae bacterium]